MKPLKYTHCNTIVLQKRMPVRSRAEQWLSQELSEEASKAVVWGALRVRESGVWTLNPMRNSA